MSDVLDVVRVAGIAILVGAVVLLGQLGWYRIWGHTKPNIRVQVLTSDETGDTVFFIRNLDAVHYKSPLRIKLEPLAHIRTVDVHAGPWCSKLPIEVTDHRNPHIAIEFTAIPADATFSIKVVPTAPEARVQAYLDESSVLTPLDFAIPLPKLRRRYFVGRRIVGIVGFELVFLAVLYLENVSLRWADWPFLAAAVPLALAVFTLVVPTGGKSTIAGYLGWNGAAKSWPKREERPLPHARKRCDVVIVVALAEELTPFRRLIELEGPHTHPLEHWTATIETKDGNPRTIAFVVQRDMGGIEASSLTMRSLTLLQPEVVLMSGIMGGFGKHVSLGDVVVAKESVDYAFGKVSTVQDSPFSPKKEKTQNRPHRKELDGVVAGSINTWIANDRDEDGRSRYLQSIRSDLLDGRGDVGRNFGARIHLGPVASGPLVVASEQMIDKLFEINPKFHGVEMEIHGVMHAAHQLRVPAVGVKAVSDLATTDKDIPTGAEGEVARQYATRASAAVCIQLVRAAIV